jgi:hypothetical protein
MAEEQRSEEVQRWTAKRRAGSLMFHTGTLGRVLLMARPHP